MTVFEDSVFWSERYTSKVMKTNKFHGGNITTLMSSIYQPMGLVMDHPIKQPAGNYQLKHQIYFLIYFFYHSVTSNVIYGLVNLVTAETKNQS